MHKSEINKEKSILSFGEIMLRLTPTSFQRIIQSEKFEATYGGGEANVICSLSMFGHNTKFLTKLPNNTLGDKVIRDLKSFGVDTTKILRGDGRLGIYFLEQGYGVRSSNVIYDRKYSAISLVDKSEFDFDEILQDVKMLHISGITPALSSNLYDISIDLIKEASKRKILISYDSNFRSKLWSLEEARKFMLEILPYVDIAFLGILDFKNILQYEVCDKDDLKKQLTNLYSELFKNYPNLKYAASTKRTVNSTNNNLLKGFLFDGKNISSSREYNLDIIDRVGGGDSFTAGVLHGVLTDMESNKIIEFATAASALKHSIKGDINLIELEEVNTLMNCGIGNINR